VESAVPLFVFVARARLESFGSGAAVDSNMAARRLVDPTEETTHRHVELGSDDEDTIETGATPSVSDDDDAPSVRGDEDDDDDSEALADELDADERVDVWPAGHLEKVAPPIVEPGLSVDPDDLGKQWLSTATEQGNFESAAEPVEDGVLEGGVQIKKVWKE